MPFSDDHSDVLDEKVDVFFVENVVFSAFAVGLEEVDPLDPIDFAKSLEPHGLDVPIEKVEVVLRGQAVALPDSLVDVSHWMTNRILDQSRKRLLVGLETEVVTSIPVKVCVGKRSDAGSYVDYDVSGLDLEVLMIDSVKEQLFDQVFF
jgi:hypothetical protein